LRQLAVRLAYGMASTLQVAREQTEERNQLPGLTLTDLLLLCMAVIWGVNYVVVKYATGELPPLAFNSARVLLAVVVLFGIVTVNGYALPRGRDLLSLLALGALGNGLYQIFFIEGIARTRAGDAALLISAAPAFMAILGWLRGTEQTGVRGVTGIALSLVGMALVVFGNAPGDAGGNATLVGNALILASCLCWSVYSVLLKPYTERIQGLPLHATTMLGGSIPLVLVSLPTLARTQWSTVSTGGWLAVAYSGLIALSLAYLFWYRGVKMLGPTRSAMYANLQPLIALSVAWATLHETPHWLQLAGAAFILAGLVLTRLPSRHTAPPCE
jgi:drug/metabolite transporter (DMT)-like permease